MESTSLIARWSPAGRPSFGIDWHIGSDCLQVRATESDVMTEESHSPWGDNERSAVTELEVSHLKSGAHGGDDRLTLARIELKSRSGRDGKWHEYAATTYALMTKIFLKPVPGEYRDPIAGAIVVKGRSADDLSYIARYRAQSSLPRMISS